ncbi:hypothetical protein ACROYT_G036337 [Oculina patagonica]
MSIFADTKQVEPSFQRLLTCLEQIRHKFDSREDDYQLLCNYFHSEDFRKLLKVHRTVSHTDNGKREVVDGSAVELAEQVVESLLPYSGFNKETQELQHILRKPHFKGLLQAHDSIAAGNFTSVEDEVTSEQLLINLDKKPKEGDNGEIIASENHYTDKNKHVSINDNDDEDKIITTPVITVDQESISSSDDTEEIDDTDENNMTDHSDMNTEAVEDTTNDNAEEHVKENEIHVEDYRVEGDMVVEVTDNATRTIRMFRNAKESLGITVKAVRSDGNKERIIVARILSGGLADTFASLCVDDEILEINGRRVEGMTANEVADLMDGVTGSVDIKILPAKKDRKLTRETKVSLRAFFDYNPLQDPLIPCKEVGVAFSTGDILHVVNMDDAKWWQARKDGCSHDKAGLIPSKDFQEKRRQLNKISSSNDVTLPKDKNGKRTSPFKRLGKKTDSNQILCNFLQDVQMDGWPAYEPVARYLERPEKKRLLLLIGAPGVGRNEIKKMLLSSSPDKFITTVPHTSRSMKSYEADGRDYFFVSRQTMENFIQKRKFIEFGEYKGCLYGTSKDSIKRAMKSGKTCVLKVQPEVMLLLRTAEFKPYCVYVKPPTLKELRTSRLAVQQKGKQDKSSMRTFKEEELQEMITTSRQLEDTYGQFFDLTVVNKDIEEAYTSIIDTFERLEQDEHWVPSDWAQKN